MTERSPWSRGGTFRIPLVVCLCLLGGLVSPAAKADEVDVLAGKLRRHPNYKVRVTAAIVLGKRCDPRALRALLQAATSDSNDLVRSTAMAALARFGLPSVGRLLKKELRKARGRTRKQLRRTLGRLCPGPGRGRTLYVDLSRITYQGPSEGRFAVDLLRCRLARRLHRERDILLAWKGCKKPSRRNLARKHVRGYYLDIVLKLKKKGSMLSCKLRPTIFTYPRGRLRTTGGGTRVKVTGGLTPATVDTCLDYGLRAIYGDIVQTLRRL